MAFLPYKFDGSVRPQSIEYLPAGAITPKVGMVLRLDTSTGLLAVCADSDNPPKYLSLVQRGAALTSGEVIPVMRINPDMVFETTFSASATSRKAGEKVTISNGVQATATTTKGVCEIVKIIGTGASGDKVLVRLM